MATQTKAAAASAPRLHDQLDEIAYTGLHHIREALSGDSGKDTDNKAKMTLGVINTATKRRNSDITMLNAGVKIAKAADVGPQEQRATLWERFKQAV